MITVTISSQPFPQKTREWLGHTNSIWLPDRYEELRKVKEKNSRLLNRAKTMLGQFIDAEHGHPMLLRKSADLISFGHRSIRIGEFA
jgi:hypothetical protein